MVDDDTPRGRLDQFAIDTHFDFGMDIDASFVECDEGFLFGIEGESFALRTCAFLSDII